MKTSSDATTYVHYLAQEHATPELALLNQEEQQQAAAFMFDQHRNLYVVAHGFLRKVLSHHTGYPPKDWRFHRNSHGKPFISNPEFKSLQFNLSHTQGMIVCAVNKKQVIGVDVEGSRPLKYIKQMCKKNYTNQERADIFSTNFPEKQLHRFYTYWTLKESLVKAIGCGLSMPLKRIGFIQLKNNDWTLETDAIAPSIELDNNWIFKNKIISKNHQTSIAIKSDLLINTSICYVNSNHKNSQLWKEKKL